MALDLKPPRTPGRGTKPRRPLLPANLRRMVAEIVLETTSEGVWLIDAESRTSFVNERTAQVLGYSVDEMLGQHLFAFMDAEGQRLCEENLKRRKEGVEEQHEFRFVRKDGTSIWTLLCTNPVYDRAGGYAGALAMVVDITVQKRREHELSTRMHELEVLVEIQKRQLAEVNAELASLALMAAPCQRAGVLAAPEDFKAHLTEELSDCVAHARRSSVLVIGLGGISACTQRHGQAVARRLVEAIGTGLRPGAGGGALLRSTDVVARPAPDRYWILTPGVGLEDGSKLATRIVEAIHQVRVWTHPDGAVHLRASVGIASYPYHSRIPAGLLVAAERAMLAARRAGGGRVELADVGPAD